MVTCKEKFINHFFKYLSELDYLWLKATLKNPIEVPNGSDIDLFIKEEKLGDVLHFIAAQPDIVHVERSDGFKVVFLHLFFQDGTFLKVDLLTKLVRKQWAYLEEEYLFAHRIWKNGIATYSKEVLLEHLLLFNFLNGSALPKKYLTYFSATSKVEQKKLLDFINEKYKTSFSSVNEMGEFSPKTSLIFTNYLKNTKANKWWPRQLAGIRFFKSKAKGWNRFKSEVITFSGVDGAGKTTLLNDLKTVLSEQFQRRVVVLRHRPSLLPILSAWTMGKAAAEQKAATTLPRQGSNHSTFKSLLRFAYYYSDYLLGQVYVWSRYTLLGYTVIYDRYYFDFIIDGKRSNISLGERLPKWLYRFVAKPNLNVFLYASPSVILQRKQELPANDIEQMTGRYQALFGELAGRYGGQYLCLENLDRQQSLATILEHLLSVQKQ